MGWFHQTLRKLRRLLAAVKGDATDQNFRAFYAEVEERLKFLDGELETIRFIHSDARMIQEEMTKIRSSFEDLLFLKDDIYTKDKREKDLEMRRFTKAIDGLSAAIEQMNRHISPLMKAIDLLKHKEKKIEE